MFSGQLTGVGAISSVGRLYETSGQIRAKYRKATLNALANYRGVNSRTLAGKNIAGQAAKKAELDTLAEPLFGNFIRFFIANEYHAKYKGQAKAKGFLKPNAPMSQNYGEEEYNVSFTFGALKGKRKVALLLTAADYVALNKAVRTYPELAAQYGLTPNAEGEPPNIILATAIRNLQASPDAGEFAEILAGIPRMAAVPEVAVAQNDGDDDDEDAGGAGGVGAPSSSSSSSSSSAGMGSGSSGSGSGSGGQGGSGSGGIYGGRRRKARKAGKRKTRKSKSRKARKGRKGTRRH